MGYGGAPCGLWKGMDLENESFRKSVLPEFPEEGKEEWEKLAEAYTEETGVPVTVKTVKAGVYDQKLKSEMKKDDAPTMFLGFFCFLIILKMC